MNYTERRAVERRTEALRGWRVLGIRAERRRAERRANWFEAFEGARVKSFDANGNRIVERAQKILIERKEF